MDYIVVETGAFSFINQTLIGEVVLSLFNVILWCCLLSWAYIEEWV